MIFIDSHEAQTSLNQCYISYYPPLRLLRGDKRTPVAMEALSLRHGFAILLLRKAASNVCGGLIASVALFKHPTLQFPTLKVRKMLACSGV